MGPGSFAVAVFFFLVNLAIFLKLRTQMLVIIQLLAGEDSSAAVDI